MIAIGSRSGLNQENGPEKKSAPTGQKKPENGPKGVKDLVKKSRIFPIECKTELDPDNQTSTFYTGSTVNNLGFREKS